MIAVKHLLGLHLRGLDFADALHWASSSGCDRLMTVDDRGFARRARRLELTPEVALAKQVCPRQLPFRRARSAN